MYAITPRTTATRLRERMSYDTELVHSVLDEAWFCHLSFVVDGEPRVLPTLHVRIGEVLYVHGSTGSRPLLAAREPDGLPVCVVVTHIDGLVLARSQFQPPPSSPLRPPVKENSSCITSICGIVPVWAEVPKHWVGSLV